MSSIEKDSPANNNNLNANNGGDPNVPTKEQQQNILFGPASQTQIRRELELLLQQQASAKNKIPPPLPAPAPRDRYDVRLSLTITFNPTSVLVSCINDMFPNEAMWAKIVAPKISSLVDSLKHQLNRVTLDLGMGQGHKAAVDAGFTGTKSKECIVPAGSGVSVVRRAAVSTMRMKKLNEEERIAVNQEWSSKLLQQQQQQQQQGTGLSIDGQKKSGAMMSSSSGTSLSAHIAEEVAAAIRDIPDLVTVEASEPCLRHFLSFPQNELPKFQFFQRLSLPRQMRFNELSQSVVLTEIIDACCDYDHRDLIALDEKRRAISDESQHPLLWKLVLVHTTTHSPVAGAAGLILPVALRGNAELRTDLNVVQLGGGSDEQIVVTTLSFEWTVPASWAEAYDTKKNKSINTNKNNNRNKTKGDNYGSSGEETLAKNNNTNNNAGSDESKSSDEDDDDDDVETDEDDVEEDFYYSFSHNNNNDEGGESSQQQNNHNSNQVKKSANNNNNIHVSFEDEEKQRNIRQMKRRNDKMNTVMTKLMKREEEEKKAKLFQQLSGGDPSKKYDLDFLAETSGGTIALSTLDENNNQNNNINTNNFKTESQIIPQCGSLPTPASWMPPKHQTWSLAQVRWKRKRMMKRPNSNNAREIYARIYSALAAYNNDIRRVPPLLLDTLSVLCEIEAGTIRADSVDERRRAPLLWMLENAARIPQDVLRECVLTLLDLGSPNFLCQNTFSRKYSGESFKTTIDILRGNEVARNIVIECQARTILRHQQQQNLQLKSSKDGSNHNNTASGKPVAPTFPGSQMGALRNPVLDIPPGRCRFAAFSATKEHVVYTVSPEGRLLLWDIKLRTCLEMGMMESGSRFLVIPLFPLTKRNQTLRQRLTVCHPHGECDMIIVSSGEILTVDFANVAGPRVEVAAKTGVRPDLFEGDGQGWCCTFAWNVQDYMPKPKAEVDRATRVARHLRELGARTDILKSDDELRARNAQSAAASLSKVVSGGTSNNNNKNQQQQQVLKRGNNDLDDEDGNEKNDNSANNFHTVDAGATTYKEILPPGVISARQSHIDFGRRLVMFPYGQSAALAEGFDDDEFEEILAGRGGRRNKNSAGGENDNGSVSLDMIEKRTGAKNRTDQNEAVKKMILSGIPAGQDQQADFMQKRKQLKVQQEQEKREQLRQLQLQRGLPASSAIGNHQVSESNEMDADDDADDDDNYQLDEDDEEYDDEEMNGDEEDHERNEEELDKQQRRSSVRFALGNNSNSNAKNNNKGGQSFERMKSSFRRQRSIRSGTSANSEPFVDVTNRNLLRHNRSKIPPPPIAVLALVIDSRPIVLHLRAAIFTHLDIAAPVEKRARLLAQAIDESLKCVEDRRKDSFVRRPSTVSPPRRKSSNNSNHVKVSPKKQQQQGESEQNSILDAIAAEGETVLQQKNQNCLNSDNMGIEIVESDGDENEDGKNNNNNSKQANSSTRGGESSTSAPVLSKSSSVRKSSPKRKAASKAPVIIAVSTAQTMASSFMKRKQQQQRHALHFEAFGAACPETFVTGLVFSASSMTTSDPILFAMADGNLIEYRTQTRCFNVFKSSLKLDQLPQDGPAETAVFRIARGHATCCIVAPILPDPQEKNYVIEKGITPNVTTSFCAWCGKDFAVSTSTIENGISSQDSPRVPASIFEPFVTVPDDAADSERTTGFVLPHLFGKEDEFYSHLLIFVRRGELCVLDTRRSGRVMRLLRIEATETELVLRRRLGDTFDEGDAEAALSSGLKICNVNANGSLILVTCRDFDSAAVFHTDVLREAVTRAIVAGLPSKHRELELVSQSVIEEQNMKRLKTLLKNSAKNGGNSNDNNSSKSSQYLKMKEKEELATLVASAAASNAMPKESLLSFWSRFVCPDQASFASKCQHIGFFMRLLEIAIKGTSTSLPTSMNPAADSKNNNNNNNKSIEDSSSSPSASSFSSGGDRQKIKIKAGTVGIHARDGKGGTIFHSFSSILLVWDLSVFSIDVARRWLEILMQHRVNFWIPCNKYRPVDAFRSSDDVFQLLDVFKRENEMQEYHLSPKNILQSTNDIRVPSTIVASATTCLCSYEDYVMNKKIRANSFESHHQHLGGKINNNNKSEEKTGAILANNAQTGSSFMALANSGRAFIAFGGHLFCLLPSVSALASLMNQEEDRESFEKQLQHEFINQDDADNFSEHEEDFQTAYDAVMFPDNNAQDGNSNSKNKNKKQQLPKNRLIYICHLPQGKNVPFSALRHSDFLDKANLDILMTEAGQVLIISINNNNNYGKCCSQVETFSLGEDILAKKFKEKFEKETVFYEQEPSSTASSLLSCCGVLKASMRNMNAHPEKSLFFNQPRHELFNDQRQNPDGHKSQGLPSATSDALESSNLSMSVLANPNKQQHHENAQRHHPGYIDYAESYATSPLSASLISNTTNTPRDHTAKNNNNNHLKKNITTNNNNNNNNNKSDDLCIFFTIATREKNREEACVEILSRVVCVTITAPMYTIKNSCKEISRLLQIALDESLSNPQLSIALPTKIPPETLSRDILLAEHCCIKENQRGNGNCNSHRHRHQDQKRNNKTHPSSEPQEKNEDQNNNTDNSHNNNNKRNADDDFIDNLQEAEEQAQEELLRFLPSHLVIHGLALIGRLTESTSSPFISPYQGSSSFLEPQFEGFSWSFSTRYANGGAPGEIAILDAGDWPTGPCQGFSKSHSNASEKTTTVANTSKITIHTLVTPQADFLIALSRGAELFVFKRSPKSAHASALLLPSLHLDPEPDAAFAAESIQCCWGSRKQNVASVSSMSENHGQGGSTLSPFQQHDLSYYFKDGNVKKIVKTIGERSEALYIMRDGLLLVYDVQTELLLILGKVTKTTQEYDRLKKCEPEMMMTKVEEFNAKMYNKRNNFSKNDVKEERKLFDPTLVGGEEMLVWDDTNDLDGLRTSALMDYFFHYQHAQEEQFEQNQLQQQMILTALHKNMHNGNSAAAGGANSPKSLNSVMNPAFTPSSAFCLPFGASNNNLKKASSRTKCLPTGASMPLLFRNSSAHRSSTNNKSSFGGATAGSVFNNNPHYNGRVGKQTQEQFKRHQRRVVYQPKSSHYLMYTASSAMQSLLHPTEYLEVVSGGFSTNAAAHHHPHHHHNFVNVNTIDNIFRISATHGFISKISLRSENVASAVESDSPPLLLCHRAVSSKLPKPVPTKLLRSYYQMRSCLLYDEMTNGEGFFVPTSSSTTSSSNSSEISSWIEPYLVELCGENDNHVDKINSPISSSLLVPDENQGENVLNDASTSLVETKPILAAIRDGDGQLPFYIFGRWLIDSVANLSKSSFSSGKRKPRDGDNTQEQEIFERKALSWCRKLLFQGHSPYLTASNPSLFLSATNKITPEIHQRQQQSAIIEFSKQMFPLIAKIEKESCMNTQQVSRLHCPISIFSADEQPIRNDDSKVEANDGNSNDNNIVVSQLSWSCARSGMIYLLTEEGGLSLCLFSTSEEIQEQESSPPSSHSSAGQIRYRKQLLPSFSLNQGTTMFVTSMRDHAQIQEMRNHQENPIKNLSEHFAVPPLTWKLAQMFEDIIFFSDGSAFAVRLAESEYHQNSTSASSVFFHATIEKLLRSVADCRLDDDYDPKQVEPVHFCWKEEFHDEAIFSQNKQQQNMNNVSTDNSPNRRRNAGHLHNGAVEGVAAKWLETVNVNPAHLCCSLAVGKESSTGSVTISIRTLFPPSGINTLFPRHVPTMLREHHQSPSSHSFASLELPSDESWMIPPLVHEHRVSEVAKHRATIRFVSRNSTTGVLRWCVSGGCYSGGCWIVDQIPIEIELVQVQQEIQNGSQVSSLQPIRTKRVTSLKLECVTKLQFPWRNEGSRPRNLGFPIEFLMCRKDLTLPDAFKTAIVVAGFAEDGIAVGAYRQPPSYSSSFAASPQLDNFNSLEKYNFTFSNDDDDNDDNHGANNNNNNKHHEEEVFVHTVQMESRCDAIPTSVFQLQNVSSTASPLCYGAQHPHEPIVVTVTRGGTQLIIFDWLKETLHTVNIARFTKENEKSKAMSLTAQEKEDEEIAIASSDVILRFSTCGNFLSLHWLHIKSVFIVDFSEILWQQKEKRPFILAKRNPRAHARANARFIGQITASAVIINTNQLIQLQSQEPLEFETNEKIPISARKRQQLIVQSSLASRRNNMNQTVVVAAANNSFVDPVLSEVVAAFKNAAQMGTIVPHLARDAENCSWLHRAASQLCFVLAKKQQMITSKTQKSNMNENDDDDNEDDGLKTQKKDILLLEQKATRDVLMAAEFGCGFFCFNSAQIRPFDEFMKIVDLYLLSFASSSSSTSLVNNTRFEFLKRKPIFDLLYRSWSLKMNPPTKTSDFTIHEENTAKNSSGEANNSRKRPPNLIMASENGQANNAKIIKPNPGSIISSVKLSNVILSNNSNPTNAEGSAHNVLHSFQSGNNNHHNPNLNPTIVTSIITEETVCTVIDSLGLIISLQFSRVTEKVNNNPQQNVLLQHYYLEPEIVVYRKNNNNKPSTSCEEKNKIASLLVPCFNFKSRSSNAFGSAAVSRNETHLLQMQNHQFDSGNPHLARSSGTAIMMGGSTNGNGVFSNKNVNNNNNNNNNPNHLASLPPAVFGCEYNNNNSLLLPRHMDNTSFFSNNNSFAANNKACTPQQVPLAATPLSALTAKFRQRNATSKNKKQNQFFTSSAALPASPLTSGLLSPTSPRTAHLLQQQKSEFELRSPENNNKNNNGNYFKTVSSAPSLSSPTIANQNQNQNQQPHQLHLNERPKFSVVTCGENNAFMLIYISHSSFEGFCMIDLSHQIRQQILLDSWEKRQEANISNSSGNTSSDIQQLPISVFWTDDLREMNSSPCKNCFLATSASSTSRLNLFLHFASKNDFISDRCSCCSVNVPGLNSFKSQDVDHVLTLLAAKYTHSTTTTTGATSSSSQNQHHHQFQHEKQLFWKTSSILQTVGRRAEFLKFDSGSVKKQQQTVNNNIKQNGNDDDEDNEKDQDYNDDGKTNSSKIKHNEFTIGKIAVCPRTSNFVVKFVGGAIVFYPFHQNAIGESRNAINNVSNAASLVGIPVRLDLKACIETAMNDCKNMSMKQLSGAPAQNCSGVAAGFVCQALAIDENTVAAVFGSGSTSLAEQFPSSSSTSLCSFLTVWDIQKESTSISIKNHDNSACYSTAFRKAQAPLGHDVVKVLQVILNSSSNQNNNNNNNSGADKMKATSNNNHQQQQKKEPSVTVIYVASQDNAVRSKTFTLADLTPVSIAHSDLMGGNNDDEDDEEDVFKYFTATLDQLKTSCQEVKATHEDTADSSRMISGYNGVEMKNYPIFCLQMSSVEEHLHNMAL